MKECNKAEVRLKASAGRADFRTFLKTTEKLVECTNSQSACFGAQIFALKDSVDKLDSQLLPADKKLKETTSFVRESEGFATSMQTSLVAQTTGVACLRLE